ncbi:MAG TPA: alpha/beta hydrolase-fold protein [Streptosporangiaceae bacterium]|nr:alpha/beta hydrolase-fold protein [Streptosporangiaceae bacterium]
MFEPQGAGFFLLLMVIFAALIVWVALAKQVVFRVLAACLAFVPAMAFGIASVNKFYDYYQTWGGMISDLTGQGASSIPKYAVAAGSNRQFDKDIGRVTSTAEDAQVGYLFQTTIVGQRSRLARNVYVYLPPQYFQKAYAHYKFPAIELLHGSPGNPEAWLTVLDVIPTFLNLLEAHPSDAAILVMPDTDGGQQYGLQCLNNPGGIQDMTFVAEDVPNYLARFVRVQAPGPAWGVAGYSEGGYCAANIALQEPARYGAAGVMSGYFVPIQSQVPKGNKAGGTPYAVNVFAGHPALQLVNSPGAYITKVPLTVSLPAFWLAAGAEDKQDVSAAANFRQLVLTRLLAQNRLLLQNRPANVPFMIVPGGGHQGSVWRAALGPMLAWMTPQLAVQAAKADAAAAAAQGKANPATAPPSAPRKK